MKLSLGNSLTGKAAATAAFDPSDVSLTAMRVWLDARNGMGAVKPVGGDCANGDDVGNWQNTEGTGNDYSDNSTGANIPKYRAAPTGFNSQAAVQFPTATSYLRTAAGGTEYAQPLTALIVAKTMSNGNLWCDGRQNGKRLAFFGTGGNFAMFGGATVSDGSHNNNTHVIIGVFSGASSWFTIDGGSQTSGNAGTNAFEEGVVGNAYTLTGGPSCHVAQLIIWSGAITHGSDDYDNLVTWAKDLYGIS